MQPPKAGGELAPVWPGSALHWQRVGCERHPILLLRRRGEEEASEEAAEEMRVVFNGARHCYSLRDAKTSEPAWLGGLRHAWRGRLYEQRLPLPPDAHAAAARLLGLRGPCAVAKHEALHIQMEQRSSGA